MHFTQMLNVVIDVFLYIVRENFNGGSNIAPKNIHMYYTLLNLSHALFMPIDRK